MVAKASVSRNFRFPTLNDLYFLPGGNPDLKKEHGISYDGGVSFAVGRGGSYSLHGEATWFDSYSDDWIVWLPTFKGFWTPKNIKEVHAYGVELKAGLDWQPAPDWQLNADGNFSWTPSINNGDPVDWYDKAIGKQLVYIPEYSASVTGRLTYRSWRFIYTVKGVVNNLFNEEYESVLSRPMPRLNYELFLDIRPRWGRRR